MHKPGATADALYLPINIMARLIYPQMKITYISGWAHKKLQIVLVSPQILHSEHAPLSALIGRRSFKPIGPQFDSNGVNSICSKFEHHKSYRRWARFSTVLHGARVWNSVGGW